jgi:uncharacterized protein (TIGR02996 family)
MNDEQALLRTIAEYPDEDAPRLIYADWLEESADPINLARAELIRLHREARQLVPGGHEHWTNHAQQMSILRDYQDFWWQQLPQIEGVQWDRCEGSFFTRASLTIDTLLHSHEAIFSAAPIERISFQEVSVTALRMVTRQSWMNRVRFLDLYRAEWLDVADRDPRTLVEILLTSENLQSLEGITLDFSDRYDPSLMEPLRSRFREVAFFPYDL